MANWFGQKPSAAVLRLVTESGDEVRATADHPFWTPDGMVPVGRLRPGDRVAVAPFRGVPYEAPSDDVIVSEADVTARLAALDKGAGGNGVGQTLDHLRARGLLPLRRSSPALPYLCKILGFVLGDGAMHFQAGRGKGVVHFYGRSSDLESIRADLAAVGVTPSRVYQRERRHSIQTQYATYTFDRREEWFKVVGSGFAALLACLGAPVGKKTHQDYPATAWLNAAPLWQKRLFLAALFGAELTTPATITGHGTVFCAPTLAMNKRRANVASGRHFLERISAWLKGFGVATQALLIDTVQENADGERSERLRLVLSPRGESLLNLWGRVGYEYNRKRSGLAALAVQYLKRKERTLAVRDSALQAARALAGQGIPRKEIMRQLVGPNVNHRFIERSLYEGRRTSARVGGAFPTFAAFCKTAGDGLPAAGMAWERVAHVEAVQHDGEVYDFTVDHPDHNFVADGFVVSNCGVRLVRSNLYYRDVKRELRPLVEALFRNVPTGVGRSGRYKFDKKELHHILGEGPSYLLGRGLATRGDIDHTEAEGRLDGADPDVRQRPRPQPRGGAVRHARLRQPLPGSAGRRSRLRRGGGRRHRTGKGHGVRDDPQRLARPGLSGLRRRPGVAAQRPARSTASSCPTASSPAPRWTARRARSTSPPCARPPTSPGATASC